MLHELREQLATCEQEINNLRNMKKGGVKKNKDRIAHLTQKMLLIRPVRERLEELTICLEYLDERRLKQFRNLTS